MKDSTKAWWKRWVWLILAGTFILISVVGVVLFFVLWRAPAFEGEGTEQSPYLIQSKEELLEFADYASSSALTQRGKCYLLTQDIDLGGAEWTPVGGGISHFEGKFDGGGHTVSDFTLKVAGPNVGFFAYIGQGTEVKNLNLAGVQANCTENTQNLGILVGYAEGAVSGCKIQAELTVSGQPANVGGLVGYTTANIANCESGGMMKVAESERTQNANLWPVYGGIVGGTTADILDCTNRMELQFTRPEASGDSRQAQVGGIAGRVNGARYAGLVNYADLHTVGGLGGILCDLSSENAVVENCKNYGNLYSTSDLILDIGGIVARSYPENGTRVIKNCLNEGDISLDSLLKRDENGGITVLSCFVGGVFGSGRVDLENCASRCDLDLKGEATHYAGGVACQVEGTLKNSYHIGSIRASSEHCSVIIGGVVGIAAPGKGSHIFGCYHVGSLAIHLGEEDAIPARNHLVGAVMGYNHAATNRIYNNYFDSDSNAEPEEGYTTYVYWYGEEDVGGAENVHSDTIHDNGPMTAETLKSGSTPEGFVSAEEGGVWVFEAGEYPRLAWEG